MIQRMAFGAGGRDVSPTDLSCIHACNAVDAAYLCSKLLSIVEKLPNIPSSLDVLHSGSQKRKSLMITFQVKKVYAHAERKDTKATKKVTRGTFQIRIDFLPPIKQTSQKRWLELLLKALLGFASRRL